MMNSNIMSEIKMNGKSHKDQESFYDEPSIISGDNLHKTYLFGLEGVAALRGVSVNIKQG